MIDYNELDPGIRATVYWLNEQGFVTTDSGDGVTKLAEDHPQRSEALPFPHVALKGDGNEAERLCDELTLAGAAPRPGYIQYTYDPVDGSQIIMLMNLVLTDDGWKDTVLENVFIVA